MILKESINFTISICGILYKGTTLLREYDPSTDNESLNVNVRLLSLAAMTILALLLRDASIVIH